MIVTAEGTVYALLQRGYILISHLEHLRLFIELQRSVDYVYRYYTELNRQKIRGDLDKIRQLIDADGDTLRTRIKVFMFACRAMDCAERFLKRYETWYDRTPADQKALPDSDGLTNEEEDDRAVAYLSSMPDEYVLDLGRFSTFCKQNI